MIAHFFLPFSVICRQIDPIFS
uniref:Uncharacterized protein n=1 Tax=Heterorhabditis bacteriophora TaxID=37862 RepID=A0A1I7X413_HETBA